MAFFFLHVILSTVTLNTICFLGYKLDFKKIQKIFSTRSLQFTDLFLNFLHSSMHSILFCISTITIFMPNILSLAPFLMFCFIFRISSLMLLIHVFGPSVLIFLASVIQYIVFLWECLCSLMCFCCCCHFYMTLLFILLSNAYGEGQSQILSAVKG